MRLGVLRLGDIIMSEPKNKRWICGWEQLCIDFGFTLLHNGQNNPGQFELPPEEVRFYTMLYQGVLDGAPISTYVKFIYDLREGEVDMQMSWRDPRTKKKKAEKSKLDMPAIKEVLNAKT